MVSSCLCAVRIAALAALVATASPVAIAAQVNLILSDVDLVYDVAGQTVHDTASPLGGNLAQAESDALASTVFEIDNVLLASASSASMGSFADLGLVGLPALGPLSPPRLSVAGFGIDWFTGTGDYLRLSIESVDVLLNSGVMFFSTEAAVISQSLPSGLRVGPTVMVSFTASTPVTQGGPNVLASATASGAMTISGLLIPEPAAIGLVGLVGLSIGVAGAFRQQS
ncbi:MAG: hypothetical protein ACRCT8_03390 [Lacipirellulaceae bacterium]